MADEKLGKDENVIQKKTSRIPDPARRKMLKKLRAIAVAVPAAAVLLGSKEDALGY